MTEPTKEIVAKEKDSRLAVLIAQKSIVKRFEDVLHGESSAFLSSVVSIYNGSKALQECEPTSILGAAMMAAVVKLPVSPALGFAAIVPYNGQAQFQIMSKGLIQLGIRSGQYETIHASEVYEDELADWNPITAEFTMTDKATWKQREAGQKDKIIGYVAFFKLLNGFRKHLYMTNAQIAEHGKKYSRSFGSEKGRWQTDRPAMSLKTVCKLNLVRYGYLSIELQKAIEYDTAIDVEGKVEYPDATGEEGAQEAATEASPTSKRLAQAVTQTPI